MFVLFVVFPGGHNIKLREYSYELAAQQDAKYHAAYAGAGAWFEVARSGRIVFSTKQ